METFPETDGLHLKNGAMETTFFLYFQVRTVSFREGYPALLRRGPRLNPGFTKWVKHLFIFMIREGNLFSSFTKSVGFPQSRTQHIAILMFFPNRPDGNNFRHLLFERFFHEERKGFEITSLLLPEVLTKINLSKVCPFALKQKCFNYPSN